MSARNPTEVQRRAVGESVAKGSFFTPAFRISLVGILFLSALGIRLYRIADPPLDYGVTRQYRSALIARSYYYNTLSSLPDWKIRNAQFARQRQGILEPPVMEYLTAVAYRVGGGARLWIPRTISALCWMAGGVFLMLLAERLVGADAAWVPTTVYLFLPFCVPASRTFQPDSMMIMFFTAALYWLFRYIEDASTKRVLTAALCAAAAIFIKPVCLFPLVGGFLAAIMCRDGVRGSLRSAQFWMFLVVALLPALLYYSYGLFVAGFLRGQASGSFLPYMLLRGYFWLGWIGKIQAVVGYPILLGGILGITMLRRDRGRPMMIGLWLGYLVYGLVFTYHIHTHDYYQLPLVPIVALSLGPPAAALLSALGQVCAAPTARVVTASLFAVGLLFAVERVTGRRLPFDVKDFVRVCEQVGESVGHSDRTVFLAPAYGKPLMYYGEIAGVNWPPTVELRARRLRGLPDVTAAARLASIVRQHAPEFFVVTHLGDLRKQRDLMELLGTQYRVLASTNEYFIFDLRARKDATGAGALGNLPVPGRPEQ